MEALTQWLQQLELGSLLDMVLVVAASLLCITVHESCHGLVADWLGDDTARRQGRISLNPLRHVDIMGLVMMALVRFGWAKPVSVDMRKFRNPKAGMALTALAGPLSNVLLTLVTMVLNAVLIACNMLYDSVILQTVIEFLYYVIVLSAGLAVFNLFPISPLDGSKVLFALLPDRYYEKLMRYERYGMVLLIALLLMTDVLSSALLYLRQGLLDILNVVSMPVFYATLKLLT